MDEKETVILGIFMSIFVLGLIGNLCLILALSKQIQTAWSTTTTYLLNLAVSDLLFVSTLPFWSLMYYNEKVFFYDFACVK